jgi:hypothetical protein
MATQFTVFSRLPVEVRSLIWGAAIYDKEDDNNADKYDLVDSWQALHRRYYRKQIFHTNKEARTTAFEFTRKDLKSLLPWIKSVDMVTLQFRTPILYTSLSLLIPDYPIVDNEQTHGSYILSMKGILQELSIKANLDELKAEGAKEFAVLSTQYCIIYNTDYSNLQELGRRLKIAFINLGGVNIESKSYFIRLNLFIDNLLIVSSISRAITNSLYSEGLPTIL